RFFAGADAGLCLVRLALQVVADLRRIGVGVSNALETFARDALADGGVDAYLGASRHHAGRGDGEARVERFRARAGDHDDVFVALDSCRDRPLHVHRVMDVDIVVYHHHVLDVLGGQRGEEGVLAFARLLLDGYDGVPETAAA